ncbi:hypothetical protein BHM03_00029633 [Ensete ventricosum]|nr:hypothetical protein BHM03_00029633 [Ensete ventricosum]
MQNLMKNSKRKASQDLEIGADAETLDLLAELEEELGGDDVDVVELVQGGRLVVFWRCVPQIRARRRHQGECAREKITEGEKGTLKGQASIRSPGKEKKKIRRKEAESRRMFWGGIHRWVLASPAFGDAGGVE